MNEPEDRDIVMPKSSRPMPEKTKDGDVLRIFGFEKPALRTDSSFSTQQKANMEQDDDDLIEISDKKMNSIQLSITYCERTGKNLYI
ncbi:MAG: hypothetical protein EZS28_047270 [Streblomastix strix]|uniref:Uncharacterized protein n=1 Tax=Streblomastix strix TaxID=222440 RepID=A0A5J4THC5_9EUKA|nr:MAG: hypothetical protein EZS28_047270 [Streblomastix strix]